MILVGDVWTTNETLRTHVVQGDQVAVTGVARFDFRILAGRLYDG